MNTTFRPGKIATALCPYCGRSAEVTLNEKTEKYYGYCAIQKFKFAVTYEAVQEYQSAKQRAKPKRVILR